VADLGAFAFFAQTVPGIEPIAWREMKARLSDVALIGFRRFRDGNGIVLFEYRGDPAALLRLRTTEDVFYLVAHEEHVPLDRRGLRVMQEAVRESRYFDVGLRIHRGIREGRGGGPTTFRVIARKQGARHRYRRVDAQRAVEQGILQRYNFRWQLVEGRALLEIWVTLLNDEALYGLRLSDRTMRHRAYKISHLPASLRPTVAAAMVFLSDPKPDDVFLDPMCGAGTILIERALAGRYRSLLGGDIDPTAVETSLNNIGPRYKPIRVRRWDATALPLEDASVDKVATNLPFGEQIGTHEDNVHLYPRFFREMARVVRPGGRLVTLSGERQLIRDMLSTNRELHLRQTFDILILGMPAAMYVIDRLRA
jgi:tRNA (guanine6-N2)-methyltransferase